MNLESADAAQVYRRLLEGFRQSAGQDGEARWQWLTAAHIVGQHHFRLHIDSHIAMFGFALRNRDWPESGGQLMRLALVPVGHLSGKLPAGNIGRATVSAFQPMPLDPRSTQLIMAASLASSR